MGRVLEDNLKAVEAECRFQLESSGLPGSLQARIVDGAERLIFKGHPQALVVLPLAAHQAAGGHHVETARPLGAALEFLLAAGDLLDDLQDGALPSGARRSRGERRLADDTELIVSLLILSEAAVASLAGRTGGSRFARIVADFSRFKLAAFSGQYGDVHAAGAAPATPDTALKTAMGKSGTLGRCAGSLGATLGSDDNAVISMAGDFGYHLAVAGQLNNDIADLWPGTGKLDDLAGSKPTLPVAYADAIAPGQAPEPGGAGADGRASLERRRDAVFAVGGIQFALVQAAVHVAKARTIARTLKAANPQSWLEELLPPEPHPQRVGAVTNLPADH